ncbi:MAG: methyltransferase domain-containing protein [Gemmatimonadota bacterium]
MATVGVTDLDRGMLRLAIQEEYSAVACTPEQGFHFHTGRPHALRLGYKEHWLDGIPEGAVESFAGTGNPFSLGEIGRGDQVVDVGCGAGIDSLIASRMVGPEGNVVGIDMTRAMLDKARDGAAAVGMTNVEFRQGFGEDLPVPDGWADVVISNGVMNLMPDKRQAFSELHRVLRPGGRLQIADILVQKPVSEGAKQNIDLWKG